MKSDLVSRCGAPEGAVPGQLIAPIGGRRIYIPMRKPCNIKLIGQKNIAVLNAADRRGSDILDPHLNGGPAAVYINNFNLALDLVIHLVSGRIDGVAAALQGRIDAIQNRESGHYSTDNQQDGNNDFIHAWLPRKVMTAGGKPTRPGFPCLTGH